MSKMQTRFLCRKCGHGLESGSVVTPGYKFYCPNCDEDMYGIEAVESEAGDDITTTDGCGRSGCAL